MLESEERDRGFWAQSLFFFGAKAGRVGCGDFLSMMFEGVGCLEEQGGRRSGVLKSVGYAWWCG